MGKNHHGVTRADHRHTVYRFRFPLRQSRLEENVLVLENSETERDQGIVRTQASPVRKAHPYPIIRVFNRLNSGIQRDLILGKKFSGLGLNDARKSALICRQKVISRKATVVAIKGEISRLE
jgi:hypothetical protein